MSKQMIRVALVVVGLVLVATTSALAKPEVIRVGNLFLSDDGGISPQKLPRHEQAPINARLESRIGTLDGTHPPAVKSVVADFDRTIEVDAVGLPSCSLADLEARSSADAKRACRDAIVGTGEAEVEVEFPEQPAFSATGPIIFVNGGVHAGTTLLLIHAYVAVPAPTAVVATVKITRISRGHFGLHAVARVPRIAGGSGSVTRFKAKIGRTFTFKGKKRSYLTASCPTGRYYAEGKVQFSDETTLRITHALPCTPS